MICLSLYALTVLPCFSVASFLRSSAFATASSAVLTVLRVTSYELDEIVLKIRQVELIIGCYLQSAGLTPFSTPFALATPMQTI